MGTRVLGATLRVPGTAWSGRKSSLRRGSPGGRPRPIPGRDSVARRGGCHRPAKGRPVPSAAMFERTALPAGPRVISARLPGARSVSIAAYVLAGSRLETPEEAGVAHFMEHITFKGTSRFPSTRAISRGDRGRRRVVQRRDRPRVDRLLGPRPAPRGDPGDGRPRRADRPAEPRRGGDRRRAGRDRRGDPLVPRRSRRARPDPLPAGDVRRRRARARDLRRRGRDPGAARRDDPRRSGGRPTGRRTRSSRSPATSTTTQAVELAARGVRQRQRGRARVRPGARAAGRRAVDPPRPPRREPGPADPRRARRSAATTPTPGSSRS